MRAWIDASAGIAGDMLLGALCDAGAPLGVIQEAVDAVIPGGVEITAEEVRRAGLRALKVEVTPRQDDPPHRAWRDIRAMLGDGTAREVFARLAAAEARVHGVDAEDVHFHEVGALDSIADIVGVCAAVEALGLTAITAGPVTVGEGTARTAHGVLPVPVPAVAELSRGWQITGGGRGELATPTGMALLRTLAATCEGLPPMTLETVGVGAGTKDFPSRPNVVRVLIGQPPTAAHERPRPVTNEHVPSEAAEHVPSMEAVVLEANVDDFDPRLWPGVLAALLDAGADDAWLVPILMKKGRPAHTLTALCPPEHADAVRTRMFRHTSTLGVRSSRREKVALRRTGQVVLISGHPVTVKIGYADGRIVQAMPEFTEVADLARHLNISEREALTLATHAAVESGLVVGAPWT